MANLRGVLGTEKSTVSRLSRRVISATLNTWEGKVEVTLLAEGDYMVNVNGKTVATGNVNNQEDME